VSGNDLYGPGAGALLGLAWGSHLNEREFAKQRKKLLEQANEKEIAALAQTAQKDAVRAVANAVIDELVALEQGIPVERRLSDPKNVAARAEDFIDTADAELHRLSSGRLSFTRRSIEGVKRTRYEVADLFEQGSIGQPQPGPNSRPKKKP
jgi:hypothetical protein